MVTDEQQSGKAADAISKLQGELKIQYSAISDAEEGLSDVLLNAHAATVAGRQKLNDIQTRIIDAVNNSSMSIDTPAGTRAFLTFLHSQVGAINDLLNSTSLIADDQAEATRALSDLYAIDGSSTGTPVPPTPPTPAPPPDATPTTDPVTDGDAGVPPDTEIQPQVPMPDPGSSYLPGYPLDAGIGEDPFSSLAPGLSGDASGWGGTPFGGLGGLAGAIEQLAESTSQATDHDRFTDAADHADTCKDAKDGSGSGGGSGSDKTDSADNGPDPAAVPPDQQNGMPDAGGPPPPLTPPPPPTNTVALPDGSTADARTPAAAQAVRAYLAGDTVDGAYTKNDLALPPPGTPVTNPVDPSELCCGDVGIFRDHYVVALSSVKAVANGQVVPLGSVASSPDFLGWIDPTSTASGTHPAPPPPPTPPSPTADALADAAPPVPAS